MNQPANTADNVSAQSPGAGAPANASSANIAAAAPGNAAQAHETAAAPADGGWAGAYRGDLAVEIRDGRRPGSYRVEISTTSGGGCMGVVSGTATASGDRMTFTGVDEANAPGEQCRIAITRRGDDLVIEEGDGCSAFHGASCTFDGSATRGSR